MFCGSTIANSLASLACRREIDNKIAKHVFSISLVLWGARNQQTERFYATLQNEPPFGRNSFATKRDLYALLILSPLMTSFHTSARGFILCFKLLCIRPKNVCFVDCFDFSSEPTPLFLSYLFLLSKLNSSPATSSKAPHCGRRFLHGSATTESKYTSLVLVRLRSVRISVSRHSDQMCM